MNNPKNLNVFLLLRTARGLTVKEVADALMVTPAYINAIEAGDRFPSKRLLRDYANLLGVSEETIKTFEPIEGQNLKFERTLLKILNLIVNHYSES